MNKIKFIMGTIRSPRKFYDAAFYIDTTGRIDFLNVVESELNKNSFIAPFGIPDRIQVSEIQKEEALKSWLKTNKPEQLNDRTPFERIRDIITFNNSKLMQ